MRSSIFSFDSLKGFEPRFPAAFVTALAIVADPLHRWMNLGSPMALWVTAAALVPMAVSPVVRGRIQGMDVKGNTQIIRAQVPLAEMLNYAPTLTSLTGGRGSYHMEQSHYDTVPSHLADKVIEEAKRKKEEA